MTSVAYTVSIFILKLALQHPLRKNEVWTLERLEFDRHLDRRRWAGLIS